MPLTFRRVNHKNWADFEALFDSRGAPHYCYCMVWRAVGEERHMKGEACPIAPDVPSMASWAACPLSRLWLPTRRHGRKPPQCDAVDVK